MASWQRMNRSFLGVLRKRFLVWRTLPADIHEGYLDKVDAAFGEEAVA
jgi:hypothetical protein